MSIPYKTIAFPTDLTSIDPGVVASIRSLLHEGISEFHVFYVLSVFEEIPMGYPIPAEYYREIDLAAAREVKKIANLFSGEKANVTAGVYRGRPDQTILEVSSARGADAILLLSHGKGLLGRILLGSTSTSVLHHSSIPVILLKPDPVNRELSQHFNPTDPPANLYDSLISSGEAGPKS